MSPTEHVEQAKAQKALARRNQRMRGGLLLAMAAGLLILIVGVQMFQKHDTEPWVSVPLTLLGGAMFWFALAAQNKGWLTPYNAACPGCGHNWEMPDRRDAPAEQRMPNWAHCPGCKLPMDEDALEAQLRADAEKRPRA